MYTISHQVYECQYSNSVPIRLSIEGHCIWRQFAGTKCIYEHAAPCVVAVCEYLLQLVINIIIQYGIQWAVIVPERSKIKDEVISN